MSRGGSGSGTPYADVSSKRLRAMLNEPDVARDPSRLAMIRTELRHRGRVSEQDRVRKARR